ncbi:uncharacterized protein LOC127756460 [Oryza glaberrima]|uniref:uncharacterized protein LOC127756460 n=1 Tax=Oryza glaberrima TaxID=4538 RepID=UPI00224C5D24|nr:uncharacterized protein LOC127756460 [Oryza glaberrima]
MPTIKMQLEEGTFLMAHANFGPLIIHPKKYMVSAFNPSDSFALFDAQKIFRLASFYPKDIEGSDLMKLELQLDTYIDDMREDDRLKGLNNIGELSIKLVETKKHDLYDLVYLLLKLVLILPMVTSSVERVFSAMNLVMTKVRNSMSDKLLNNCLVTLQSTHGTHSGAAAAPLQSTHGLMGLTVVRYLYQNSFWRCAHVRHHRRPSASREGARDGAAGCRVLVCSGAVVAASSSTSGEARWRTTANNADTTAPTMSRTACRSPKDPLKLLQETTKVACTEVAWKEGIGSERNRTSHSYPARAGESFTILAW